MKYPELNPLIKELDAAGKNALSKSGMVRKTLRSIRPVPIVNGEAMPQTVVFTGSKVVRP